MDRYPMTQEGHQALAAELKQLQTVERPKISKEIGIAREHGDLKENAEYHAAKERQGMIEQIQDLVADDLSTLPYLQGAQVAVVGSEVEGAEDTLDASFKFRYGALSKG